MWGQKAFYLRIINNLSTLLALKSSFLLLFSRLNLGDIPLSHKDPRFKKEAICLSLVAILYVVIFIGGPMALGYYCLSDLGTGGVVLALIGVAAAVRLLTIWFEYTIVSYYCVGAALIAALIGTIIG